MRQPAISFLRTGDTLTLGNTTLRFDITPGHTPGVLSVEFPVFDGATAVQGVRIQRRRFGPRAGV